MKRDDLDEKNQWFEKELVPELRLLVKQILGN